MMKIINLLAKSFLVIVFCIVASFTYAQSCATYTTILATECNVYTAPSGIQYTASGVYNDTISNAAGCDSIITIDLEIFFDYSTTIIDSTCGWPHISDAGNVYTFSGLYQEDYTSINGCDSILFFDLYIKPDISDPSYIDACDHWTSPSGVLYDSSGYFVEVFVNAGADGCDSVNKFWITIESVDTTASWISAMTIEANESDSLATYQWIDCNNNNTIIPGATSKTFEATANGDYACIVTKNGCIKTTNCIRVQSLGFEQVINLFSIYPNPSSGKFNIELMAAASNSKIEITNAAGQVVYQSVLKKNRTVVSLENIEAGIYFVSIKNDISSSTRSLIIK